MSVEIYFVHKSPDNKENRLNFNEFGTVFTPIRTE